MIQLHECATAQDVRAHYAALRARTRSWRIPRPRQQIIIVDLTPHAVALKISRPMPEPRPFIPPPPINPARPYPDLARIREVVGRYYKVSKLELISQRRNKRVCHPRQIVMYLAHELTPHSYPKIGKFMGNRDHTTVMSSCRAVMARMATDFTLADEIEELRRIIG